MRDIISAMLAEHAYIVSNNEKSLIDMITPFGYTNLDDYFYDKIKHQIVQENITIQYDAVEKTIDDLYYSFNNGIPSAYSIKENYNRTWIWSGRENQYLNIDKANEYGYAIRNFSYNGGPIITCNEDFNLALIIPNHIDLDVQLVLNDIIKFLESKNVYVTQDDNDLLLDGKKILGSIVCKNDKVQLIAFELSLTDNSNLVSELSFKNSTKKPGFISNINRVDLEEEFDKWLHTI